MTMQFRTEPDLKKLLQLWDGKESAKLHFSQIKKAFHWNNRKTRDMLVLAMKEGYLEKVQENSEWLYRNRMPDYTGYFNAFEFLSKIDELCRKDGRVQSIEQPLYSSVHFHVLAYGIPDLKQLTPLESELLFSILARHAHAFSDYELFCKAVRKRQELETKASLPESVKSTLFARDDESQRTPLSVTAAHTIYGDVLWEHIFSKIANDIRFALEKASLDTTGPIELLHCSRPFADLALRLAEEIFRGKLSEYSDPDSHTTMQLQSLKTLDNPFEEGPKDVAIVVTPSPQAMEEYALKVGKTIDETYDMWASPNKIIDGMIKAKGNDFWHDMFNLPGANTATRVEMLREALIDDLSSMRSGEPEPLSALDKKLMLEDKKLNTVFSKTEIHGIVDSVENLIRRARKFLTLVDQGATLTRLTKDKEWFSREEVRKYRIADRVESALDFKRIIKTSGHAEVSFPIQSEKNDDMVAGVQKKVRDELRKTRPSMKKRGQKS